MNRRQFIAAAAAAVAAVPALPQGAAAVMGDPLAALGPERRLSLTHARTGERFDGVYYANGEYVEESVAALDRLLRDYSQDVAIEMDVRLFDLLALLRAALDLTRPFHVTSGYRTRATNRRLREEGRNPSQNSLHLYGMAADIFSPGARVSDMEAAAVALRQGGVGAYPRSGFVHIDVGRVRRW